MPDNTSDLVALTQFLENASSVTVVNLQTAVDEAGERLLFLLEYATLPCMLAFYTHLIFPNLLVEFTHEVSCSFTVVSPTSCSLTSVVVSRTCCVSSLSAFS